MPICGRNRPWPGRPSGPRPPARLRILAETEADSGEDDDQPDPAPLPRPPAKAETFAEGDHVVYPTHGVGKVDRIATEEIAGHKLELIHITFEENRMTLARSRREGAQRGAP